MTPPAPIHITVTHHFDGSGGRNDFKALNPLPFDGTAATEESSTARVARTAETGTARRFCWCWRWWPRRGGGGAKGCYTLNEPLSIIGLLHYPGDHLDSSGEEIYGASAHSDYGMITLLATDGVPGLQICREKSEQPQVWEDVPSLSGAFIVNIGDMMERWTNCMFRSVLHRVLPPEQERYSVAFFANPGKDCVIECLESCCSESCPPRFPPIKYLEYMEERLRLAYGV
ncbi:hypothetical protein HRI_001309100 [Hibiscus trionum]|uniref:Fe2OG dioxygenase domain-containing protein n=1 Tax=Hibiscus trionum TaxID=183268 RepID=A0A9W7LTT8_HIBTR|nr:hypothetical protein HRI_001309100 [Hibiscus trionum]